MAVVYHKAVLVHHIVDLAHHNRSEIKKVSNNFNQSIRSNRAASIPRAFSTSKMWFDEVESPLTPALCHASDLNYASRQPLVFMTRIRSVPSTSSW